jgi:predicted transcriptional regulator
MSNRDLVIELVSRLPENTPLPEIAHEIEFLAGVREGLAQAERGEGVPAEDVRKLLSQWATKSS